MKQVTLDQWLSDQPGVEYDIHKPSCREWLKVAKEFRQTFHLVPLDVRCETIGEGLVRITVTGHLRKAKGKVVFYYYDAPSWKSRRERERRKRERDGGLPSFIADILDVVGEVEILPSGNVKVLGGEVPTEYLKGCNTIKCIKEKIEEYRKYTEQERRERERAPVYKALAERLAEVFGVPIHIFADDAEAAFKAVDVLLTFAEFFGIPPKSLGGALHRLAYFKNRAAVIDDFVLVEDRVVWPFDTSIRVTERIHEVEVDGVKFRHVVRESPYGIISAYDVVE